MIALTHFFLSFFFCSCLRINRSVCKHMTIIQQAMVEIRAFFIIFASELVAFAIATLHLLRACPVEGCKREGTGFQYNFFLALSATYFFMVGDSPRPFFFFFFVCYSMIEKEKWGANRFLFVWFLLDL